MVPNEFKFFRWFKKETGFDLIPQPCRTGDYQHLIAFLAINKPEAA
jgi:hypothetical protein